MLKTGGSETREEFRHVSQRDRKSTRLSLRQAASGIGQTDALHQNVLRRDVLSIGSLTALDFLGFGLPPGSPSLGEMVQQAKNNLQAPWLAIMAFIVISVMLSLLVFIGEATRDAFDPRKTFK